MTFAGVGSEPSLSQLGSDDSEVLKVVSPVGGMNDDIVKVRCSKLTVGVQDEIHEFVLLATTGTHLSLILRQRAYLGL